MRESGSQGSAYLHVAIVTYPNVKQVNKEHPAYTKTCESKEKTWQAWECSF